MHTATRYSTIVYDLNLIKSMQEWKRDQYLICFFHLLFSSLLTCQRKCQYFELIHVLYCFSTDTDKVSCDIGCFKSPESSSINRWLSDSIYKNWQKKNQILTLRYLQTKYIFEKITWLETSPAYMHARCLMVQRLNACWMFSCLKYLKPVSFIINFH